MNLWYGVLTVQVLTFLALGAYFLTQHHYRLGITQLLLAAVQGIIYSAGL